MTSVDGSNEGQKPASMGCATTDEEFIRSCEMAFSHLLRAAVLRERQACAAIARKAWADPRYREALNKGAFIAKQIEERQ